MNCSVTWMNNNNYTLHAFLPSLNWINCIKSYIALKFDELHSVVHNLHVSLSSIANQSELNQLHWVLFCTFKLCCMLHVSIATQQSAVYCMLPCHLLQRRVVWTESIGNLIASSESQQAQGPGNCVCLTSIEQGLIIYKRFILNFTIHIPVQQFFSWCNVWLVKMLQLTLDWNGFLFEMCSVFWNVHFVSWSRFEIMLMIKEKIKNFSEMSQ